MRFALLGNHPDGLDMARALAASGRHILAAYSGPPAGLEALARWCLQPPPVGDLEEILADPAIELVVVASGPAIRPAQLRRVLQSERHALCVHPADATPDLAYEAAMIQADAGGVLLPLLPAALHPGIARLATVARRHESSARAGDEPTPLQGQPPDFPRLIELAVAADEEILLAAESDEPRPSLPGWDLLRAVAGEIAAVYVQTATDALLPGEPILLAGRFLAGPLLQATFFPHQATPSLRLTVVTGVSRVALTFPAGWPGPATLTTDGTLTESWPALDPWPPLVARFEQAVAAMPRRRADDAPGTVAADSLARPVSLLGWQDELRALELDTAIRRSAARGRSSVLEYQEATEEANFKGTMTLFGCSLLWGSLALLILSVWLPWLGWLIVPVFGLFLLLQVLGWVVPQRKEGETRR